MRVAPCLSAAAAMLLCNVGLASADCVDDYFARPSTKRLAPATAARAMLHDAAFISCNARPKSVTASQRASTAVVPTMGSSVVARNSAPIPPEYITNVYPLLRHDFNDVWLFDKIPNVSDVPDAQGATFSFSSDNVARNTSWNVSAMGAGVFQYLHDRYPKGNEINFIGVSVAPYVEVNRITNSSAKAQVNNVDQEKFGGSGEVGFDMLGGAQYLRAQGAAVDDQIARKSSGLAVLEWIPVYDNFLSSPIEVPGIPIYYVFAPEAKLRYDDVVVNDVTGVKREMLRGGGQLMMRYGFVGAALPASLPFLQSLHGQTFVGWLSNSNSNDNARYVYLDTSLTFNLDEAGHLGVTGEYTRGRLEDTGRKVNLWKAGLTAKW